MKLNLVLDPWQMSLNLFHILLLLCFISTVFDIWPLRVVFLLLDSVLLFRDNIEL